MNNTMRTVCAMFLVIGAWYVYAAMHIGSDNDGMREATRCDQAQMQHAYDLLVQTRGNTSVMLDYLQHAPQCN